MFRNINFLYYLCRKLKKAKYYVSTRIGKTYDRRTDFGWF